jgi:hypothetical protein
MSYDPETVTLHVGDGQVGKVPMPAWEYQVAGMRVLRKWFDYRKQEPRTKWSSPLDDITARRWLPRHTTELLELLNVLIWCTDLEPQQAAILDLICAGPLITVANLEHAQILPIDARAGKAPVEQDSESFPLSWPESD